MNRKAATTQGPGFVRETGKRILLLVVAAMLVACAGTPVHPPAPPYFQAPAGSVWHLTRAVDIPAGSATLRWQAGQPVARNAVQEAAPHCVLEIDTVSERPQRVESDRFTVVRMYRTVRDLSAALPERAGYVRVSGDDGPSHLYFQTVFVLASSSQPGVRWLTCQSNQVMQSLHRPLTLDEIQHALGDWLVFEPAAPAHVANHCTRDADTRSQTAGSLASACASVASVVGARSDKA